VNRRWRNAVTSALPLVALCALSVGSSSAGAATFIWKDPVNGNFNDPNKWFPIGTPGAGDFVKFEVGAGAFTVTFPGKLPPHNIADYTTSHLRVRDNGVTFSGSSQPFHGPATYTVGTTTMSEADRGIVIGLGSGESAVLSVSENLITGAFLSSLTGVAATIGDGAGSTGTLNVNVGAFNVTGSGLNETQLIVGNHGTGTLNINNGADVNVTGFNSSASLGHRSTGVGIVNVSGAGSTWTNKNQLWVGESGVGMLTVQHGGSLRTSSAANFSNVIGTFAGSRGMVSVTGAGSTWTNSNELRVGGSGDGTLVISDGGSLINNAAAFTSIGQSTTGAAQVTGAGSTWNTPGPIHVGSTGRGALAVLDGGSLASGSARIGGLNAGAGEVLVAGGGSSWTVTSGPLEIGFTEPGFGDAPGMVTINPGATVSVAQDVDLDTNGLLRLQGGTLKAASIASLDLLSGQFEGDFEWTSGTLSVGIVGGSVTNQGGTLAPGQPAGKTTIDGNYTQQAGAALAIEIGGTIPQAQHDVVLAEGSASLDGELQLVLIGGFAPTAQQTFAVFDTAGGLTGAFSNVANGQRLTTIDGLGSFLVHYGPQSAFDPNQIILTGFESSGCSS
jgi:T5SS/PEP-CTERM-associated repeat protein